MKEINWIWEILGKFGCEINVMNKQCCLIIMFFTCGVCSAQNLVPNGSFEQYSSCPPSFGDLDSATPWIDPTTASSDYFNQCASLSTQVSDPQNYYGFQPAHSGVAYCGIWLYGYVPNFREYIEVQLTSSLISNTCYHFEMYVNLTNISNYATNSIGVYFSNTATSGTGPPYPLPYTPQINNTTGFITDTSNWILVSGNYTATGGENFITIGNFKNDLNTNHTVLQSSGLDYALVYIDDVSVTPCTTGISESNESFSLNIYPIPFNQEININVNINTPLEICLYDFVSRDLIHQKFISSTSINTEQLAKGIYLYEVRNKNGVIKKGKVVKD